MLSKDGSFPKGAMTQRWTAHWELLRLGETGECWDTYDGNDRQLIGYGSRSCIETVSVWHWSHAVKRDLLRDSSVRDGFSEWRRCE